MLDIIKDNPYRILGVYSTSQKKEIVANQGRMKAFLHVGKSISFPLDLPNVLPDVIRTEDNVKEAAAKLTLPADQLRFAQFWFANVTQFDDIACKKLTNGDMDGAVGIWSKKDNASSLQNRIVCALIRKQYQEAICYAERLYSNFLKEFVKIVLGDTATISSIELAHDFLNILCDTIGANAFLQYITIQEWKQYVGSKSTQPLIDAISSDIATAKASRGKGSAARYNAGVKLMNDTKDTLGQLKQFLSATDLQYQMIADKLGLEILQCGIDYYNDSDEPDAARKAMRLQKYAQSVVVGKMAKDRCKENVDILNKIIDNLPPTEVFSEDRAIKEELRKYCELPDKICHAITLLNNTKPYLQAIKQKLGASNAYYLKMSTQVVGNALHNLIEEVNDAQNYLSAIISAAKKAGVDPAILNILNDEHSPAKIIDNKLKPVLRQAWQATTIMDTFDMEADFKVNRYSSQRSSLKGLCGQLGISTSTYTQRSTVSRPVSSSRTQTTTKTTYTPSPNSPTSSNDDTNWGCFVAIAIAIIIGLISTCS